MRILSRVLAVVAPLLVLGSAIAALFALTDDKTLKNITNAGLVLNGEVWDRSAVEVMDETLDRTRPQLLILGNSYANTNLDIEADPAAEGTLRILGLGQASTTIEGGAGAAVGTDRVLDHEDGALTVENLTLKEGRATGTESGGGIRTLSSQAAADACGMGHTDACPFAHSLVPVIGLEGM